MSIIKKVFLDMDGLIVNLASVIEQRHDLKMTPYPMPGEWDWEKVFSLEKGIIWDKADYHFWRDAPKTPEADKIIELVSDFDTYILTSPKMTGKCINGKKDWIVEHYPQFKDKIIFAKCKEGVAAPSHLLLDDGGDKVDKFIAAGGRAVLMPRPWNRLHAMAIADPLIAFQLFRSQVKVELTRHA